MESKNKTLLILVAVLVIGIFGIVYLLSETYNWNRNYKPEREYPYGSSIFQALLKKEAEAMIYKEINKDFVESLDTLDDQNERELLVIFGNRLYCDSSERATLMRFVEKGNLAFIASENFNISLLDDIFQASFDQNGARILPEEFEESSKEPFEIEDDYYNDEYYDDEKLLYQEQGFDPFQLSPPYLNSYTLDTTSIYFQNTSFTADTASNIYMRQHKATPMYHAVWKDGLENLINVPFNPIDSSNLGICLIKVTYGKGAFWLHTMPIAFSNLELLSEDNFRYSNRVLAELPTENVIWDNTLRELKTVKRNDSSSLDSVAELREVNEGPLNYIMGQSALRCAWLLMLFLVFLYFFIGTKRKQRSLRVIQEPSNTSIEFAETLGHMFRQQNRHDKMIELKKELFFDFVMERHSIRFFGDQEKDSLKKKIKRLAEKSRISVEDIEDLFSRFNSKTVTTKSQARELIMLHQKLEEFYQKSK